MGQSQSIAPQTLRTDAYTDEKVEEFRADPLITLRNAERRGMSQRCCDDGEDGGGGVDGDDG